MRKSQQRGKRKNKKHFKQFIRFLGVNAAGIRSKLSSFKNALEELKPGVFFIEETKMKDKGKIKFNNYDIFELTRQSRDGGGGLAIGCLKELQAVCVREGDDAVEALSVDIFLKNIKIRCCAAYGCQESDNIKRKEAFWNFLNEEVLLAKQTDSGFILHFDGNLWAGEKIIPGDPKKQNRNGYFFQKFLEENPNLTVVNSLPICQGLITRRRMKNGKLEESVIDFFVVCDRVFPFLKKMVIDEEKKFVLTNFEKVKIGGKATDSDHLTQFLDIELEIENGKPERKEFYNFKKRESQEKFQQITSETTEFSECFSTNAPLNAQIENWRKLLRNSCNEAFPKIKIKNKRKPLLSKEIFALLKRRNEISRICSQKINNNMESKTHVRNMHVVDSEYYCQECEFKTITKEVLVEHKKSDHGLYAFDCEFCENTFVDKNKKEIHIIEHKISNIEAQENRNKIVKNFRCFSDNPELINVGKMWKVLKKLWPQKNSIPMAKRNHLGKIISKPREIKSLMAKEYKERLRKRPTRPDMNNLMRKRKIIFENILKVAKSRKSPKWTMEDLNLAISKLKSNKARDFEGYSNELFKNNIIGSDIKKSLLLMFNKIKENSFIPYFMNCANITTVPKKGNQIELQNERGIFRVSVLRSILMNLIYERKYPEVDKRISECQMGGRKQKGCKNNIFILNGIIHENMKSKKMKPITLQFYDYTQMFNSIDLKEAIRDMFNTGLNDENLILLYNSNKEISMAVKTAHGLSDRVVVNDSVLQGDTFGSLMASVQVDKIGQDCVSNGNHIMYKNNLAIGFLGMVDDIVGITESGHRASELNALINVKTAEKTLQFGPSKCKYMIVGKCDYEATQQNLQVDHWRKEHVENKLTGEHELTETYVGKFNMERTEVYKYLGFFISNKGNNMVNIREVKKKSFGIMRKIFTKLASLNLSQYYFECGIILMNSILRGSILYASDMYYNLKETELRQIERIEEQFLRKLLKTTKGCPIKSLYLEIGQTPARFEIMKMRLLYLKYILEQPKSSNIRQMLQLQLVAISNTG